MSRQSKNKRKRTKSSAQHRKADSNLQVSEQYNIPDPPFPPLSDLPENITDTEFQEWRLSIRLWMQQRAVELETILLRFNSFDMIANISLSQMAHDSETYKETTHKGLATIVEYITLLYLKHPFSTGMNSLIDGAVINEVVYRVRQLVDITLIHYGIESLLSEGQDKELRLNHLRYQTIADELLVRSPGYAHHQKTRLQSLFGHFDDILLQHLNFLISDVVKIEDAMSAFVNDKLFEQAQAASKQNSELRKTVKDVRTGKIQASDDDEFIQYLANLPGNKAKKIIRNYSISWIANYIGTTSYSFTIDDIARETKIPHDRIRSVLDYFSLEFGDIPPNFYELSPVHQLKDNPLIKHNELYFYPLPGSLIWAIRPRLEGDLNGGAPNQSPNARQKSWARYQSHRAKYLEEESLRLFRLALPKADIYHQMIYEVIENGVLKQTELDALIIYDTTIFLLEMKSGVLSPSARRGSKERIKDELRKLIDHPNNQATRAKRHIESAESVQFFSKDGSVINIQQKQFRRIIIVAITLEPLDIFHGNLHDVWNSGIFAESTMPWAVSLDVLQVICEHIEFPTQLVHYLIRRLRINELATINTHDELDLFGNYLLRGLYFEDEKGQVYLLSHTTPFDDYYFYEMGIRQTPTKKLRQKMPPIIRDIILEIERGKQIHGFSEIVLILLNPDEISRRNLANTFHLIRKKTQKDQKSHNFSIIFSEASFGITGFSTTDAHKRKDFEQLKSYVARKKRDLNINKWLGLLTIVDSDNYIEAVVIIIQP